MTWIARTTPSQWRTALIAAAVAVVAADWVVAGGLVWQHRATGFPTAGGTVTRSEAVTWRGAKSTTYQHVFEYQYSAGGRSHTGTRLRFYGPAPASLAEAEQRRAEYPVGRSVRVYYDPADPSAAVLRPGVEGLDWLRGLYAVAANLLVGWGLVRVFGRGPGFRPDDPACVTRTDTGREARLPGTARGEVFAVALAVGCGLAGLGLATAQRFDPPPHLVAAGLFGAVAVAAIIAAVFARQPTLVADEEAGELVLPAPWLCTSPRVPFDRIGPVEVFERGEPTAEYVCELGWASETRVERTVLATYPNRADAERLAAWVRLAVGQLPGDDPQAHRLAEFAAGR